MLDNAYLRSPDWLGLPAALRGLWLALNSFCAERENHGRIEHAARWSDEQWVMLMGTGGSKAAVKDLVSVGLAEFDDDVLIVRSYHLESEAKYRARREAGSKGGRKTAKARLASSTASAGGNTGSTATSTPVKQSEAAKGNDRESALKLVNAESAAKGRPAIGRTCSSAIRDFESRYHARFGADQPVSAAEQVKLMRLLEANTVEAAQAELLRELRHYVANDEDPSVGAFCEDRQPSAMTRR